MKTYGHLTGAERAQLELLHKQGHGPAAIGRLLGRAKSTVSRELRRFEAGVPYDAARAQAAAELLAARPRRPGRVTPSLVAEIRLALGMGWSPQQIAGRWKQQQRTAAERLSHESIYALIGADRKARGTLWQMLPRGGRRRRRAPVRHAARTPPESNCGPGDRGPACSDQ